MLFPRQVTLMQNQILKRHSDNTPVVSILNSIKVTSVYFHDDTAVAVSHRASSLFLE
uniref:Uncharacterized protein n=1 Tax=Anguilla anguilla TaxID=7936 RepID=A0A0E9VK37_ANGAN